jgi:UDP-N-acetylmuramate: L-alanyl-gamma-D-glutamyl-meso-diaminopimelate ligase
MQQPFRRIHFLGICGAAMGAVAAAIRDLGYVVSGSDENVYPPMSTFLEKKQISIARGYRPENLPPDVDLVVIGNAIFRGNPELEAVLDRKLLYRSLPETLKEFFLRGKHNIVVSGTHGKTTTTALLAWVFRFAELNPGFLIGGIARNLGTGASITDSPYFIVEGDEYDTAFFDKRSKFLHYLPECLVVNNIEFDHADVFHDLDEIKLSFRHLINIVPRSGNIFVNGDDANCREIVEHAFAPVHFVGFSTSASLRIEKPEYSQQGSRFRFQGMELQIPLIGEFNVRNAAMAAAVAGAYGISEERIQEGLARFEGVARRQEVRGEANGVKVIDDFGHHPTAIKQTLIGLRHRFPGQKLWAIFEPRSNTTRRAVFQADLPKALRLADGVILAEVARLDQLPVDDRLDPGRVVDAIQESGIPAFYEPSIDQIVARLTPLVHAGDIVVVFSNGGFGGIHERLLNALASA